MKIKPYVKHLSSDDRTEISKDEIMHWKVFINKGNSVYFWNGHSMII